MDLLLIMTYAALCVGVFKVFKIPLNKWTVPTAVLGGVLLVGGLIFLMNYNHPYSEITREYFVTTPVVPSVRGRVIEVNVKANAPLKTGDVLFRLDPVPYQNKVDGLKAQLVSATADLDRARSLLKTGAGSARNVDLARANVDALSAQLADAEYNLEQTTVRAPTDGYVTQLLLRPGMQAVPMPLRPVMVFVHKDDRQYVGWFRQNSLLRLDAGSEAEIAFDAVPGVVFGGRVLGSLPVLAEGQVQASGQLLSVSPATAMIAGRVPVLIEIDDPAFEEYRARLPGGSFGQAAIYSEHMPHVSVIRRVLLRMASWMNFFFPFH